MTIDTPPFSTVVPIGTTVLNGGVSMVIFFFVNKMLFLAAKD